MRRKRTYKFDGEQATKRVKGQRLELGSKNSDREQKQKSRFADENLVSKNHQVEKMCQLL